MIQNTLSLLMGSHIRRTKGLARNIFLKLGTNRLAFPPKMFPLFFSFQVYQNFIFLILNFQFPPSLLNREWSLIICNCSRLVLLQAQIGLIFLCIFVKTKKVKYVAFFWIENISYLSQPRTPNMCHSLVYWKLTVLTKISSGVHML